MQKTTIPWTDATWNPVTGCDPVSPGCGHCYADSIATRFKGSKAFPNGFEFTIHRDRFHEPSLWRPPSKIFTCSMSDMFHEKMLLGDLKELFAEMGGNPRHTFQVLTKRHQRLAELAPSLHWHANIWMGVSVENQKYAELRIPRLATVPARVRFLSVEPLFGPVQLPLAGIHWVILGCESGPRRKRMEADWARSVRDQCQEADVPFFMKQMEVAGKVTEDLEEMPPDLRIREWPARVPHELQLF